MDSNPRSPSGRAQLEEAQQFRYCPYRRVLVSRDHLPTTEKRARGTRRRSNGSTQMRDSPRNALSRKFRELAAWRGNVAAARPARSGPEWRRGSGRSGRAANLRWRAYPLPAGTRAEGAPHLFGRDKRLNRGRNREAQHQAPADIPEHAESHE